MMSDRHFGDTCSNTSRQRRNEPVLFGVEGDAVEQISSVGLERAAIVSDRYAGQPAYQSVGDPGGHLSEQQFILSLLAPSADEIVALIQFRDQRGNVSRIVLKVTIQGHDDLPSGMVEARHHGGSLPDVSAEP
jgi:hypothetical protein